MGSALTNEQANNAFHAKKVRLAVYPQPFGSAHQTAMWLKRREIKTLISP